MIIWQGKGYLIAIIVFLSSLVMELISEGIDGNDQFYQESPYMLSSAFFLAAIIVEIVNRKIIYTQTNKLKIETEIKTRSEEKIHSLFFIPCKYWSPILCAIGILIWG